jgi:hypothetical protein
MIALIFDAPDVPRRCVHIPGFCRLTCGDEIQPEMRTMQISPAKRRSIAGCFRIIPGFLIIDRTVLSTAFLSCDFFALVHLQLMVPIPSRKNSSINRQRIRITV